MAVDQQYACTQAPDDQFIDLGQLGGFDAALFGEVVAAAHLPAQDAGQRGDGEVTDREHHRLDQQPIAFVEQRAPEVFDQDSHRRDHRRGKPIARGQQQRGGAHVEHQHQGDAGAGGGDRVDRQQSEEQVGGDAGQRIGAQVATAAEQEQQRTKEQVGQCDRPCQQLVPRRADDFGNRPEQHQHQQRRFQ